MKITHITLLSTLTPLAKAHSWLHCTSHNNTLILPQMRLAATQYGNSHVIDPLMPWFAHCCNGWPCSKQNPGDWVDETNNYLWDLQSAKGKGDNHACHPAQRAPGQYLTAPVPRLTYHKDPAPMATSTPGGSIKLMFGGNGHRCGANAVGNGDPGKVSVYWGGSPGIELVSVDELNVKNLLQENGFSEESFAFPADMNVQTPGQGLVDKGNWQTVEMPCDMEKGRHMMVWVWSFGWHMRSSTWFDVLIE